MILQKYHGDILPLLRQISYNIDLGDIFMLKPSDAPFPGCMELLRELDGNPWVLTALAAQYYYSKIHGPQDSICIVRILSDSELERMANSIQWCFRKVPYSRVTTALEPGQRWHVKLHGISDTGIAVIESLPKNNSFYRMLHALYIDIHPVDQQAEKGWYTCIGEADRQPSAFDRSFIPLFADKYQRALDVSNLSMRQLAQCNIPSLLPSEKKMYLYVDDMDSAITKVLYWT